MTTGVVIAGTGESDRVGIVEDRGALQLQAEAALSALRNANLELGDVDGLFHAGFDITGALPLADYLGLRSPVLGSSAAGGASPVGHVHDAVEAIRQGVCEVILVTDGATGRSAAGHGASPSLLHVDPWFPEPSWEHPWGVRRPPTSYALAAVRHMHEFGTTSEQLAEIAVATRTWAQRNPRARRRDPLTVADVLESPMIVHPFHALDCCLVTDAGGAVVLTSSRRAAQLEVPMVEVLGSATCHSHLAVSQMTSLTESPAAGSGPAALRQAGVGVDMVDVAQLYDSFTFTVLVQLEDLGFCEKGAGGRFVEDGRTGFGGDVPVNTSGGGLSYTHPGTFGVFLLVEATRQLRGEADDRQVPDAELALVNAMGGYLSSSATVVLGRQA